MAAQGIVDFKKSLVDYSIVPVVTGAMRLFPDGLVISSAMFAIITLSYPYAVFSLSMMESALIFRFLQYCSSFLGIVPAYNTASLNPRCRTGFIQPNTLLSLSMFSSGQVTSPFPSAPLFMLSTASSYLFATLNSQSKELEALGAAYSSRYYMSAIFLSLLLLLFIAFRVLYECDTPGVAILTIPIGLVLGFVLVWQNKSLFGDTSINLLGIPQLYNRAASGEQIYICPK